MNMHSISFANQAVLVDMEEGVVSEAMKGPLKEVFDFQQLITDVSGSGNNWWVGQGVVSEAMKGPLKEVFDFQQLITDVSGSGNNW